MDEDGSSDQKTWQVYSFGKRNVFRLHLKESIESVVRRGRGRSLNVDGPKTEKAQEPTVESLVRGIWRLFGVLLYAPTETIGLLWTGAQDGHLDFHTAPGGWEYQKQKKRCSFPRLGWHDTAWC